MYVHTFKQSRAAQPMINRFYMLERTHPSEAEDRKRQRILEPKSPKEDKQGSKTLQGENIERERSLLGSGLL